MVIPPLAVKFRDGLKRIPIGDLDYKDSRWGVSGLPRPRRLDKCATYYKALPFDRKQLAGVVSSGHPGAATILTAHHLSSTKPIGSHFISARE